MKYYIVTAACGHVGRGRYIPIDFPIIANDPKEASRICRNIPRVKHGNKKAIMNMNSSVEVTASIHILLLKIKENASLQGWIIQIVGLWRN